MTLVRSMAALLVAGFLGACAQGAVPADDTPVGLPADPMTDAGLSPDPMNPGTIDDSVGAQM